MTKPNRQPKQIERQVAIDAAKDALASKADSWLFGSPRNRWMAAVLIRKADLKELLKAVKAKT